MEFREFTLEEKGIITFLLHAANMGEGYISKFFAETGCMDMDDGGMGSIRFVPRDNVMSVDNRRFGGEVSACSFTDEDGVLVSVALYVDTSGCPFELDVWKVDFSPLIRMPSDNKEFVLDTRVGVKEYNQGVVSQSCCDATIG